MLLFSWGKNRKILILKLVFLWLLLKRSPNAKSFLSSFVKSFKQICFEILKVLGRCRVQCSCSKTRQNHAKKQNPCTECCDVSGRCALTASLTHSGVSLLWFPLIPPQRQPPTSTLKDPIKAELHNVKYKYKIAEKPSLSHPGQPPTSAPHSQRAPSRVA